MNKKEKNQKTKYKGVFLDPNTSKYLVQTTFTTKDGYHIKKCKRGFETAKKADLWKCEQALHYSQTTYESNNIVRKGVEKLFYEYLEHKKNTCKPSTLQCTEAQIKVNFLPYFNKEAKDIVVKDIQTFYNALANAELANVTKNLIISRVLEFVEWLDIMECITPDMARKFKRLVVRFDATLDAPKEDNVFEDDEVAKILYSFNEENKKQFRYKVLFTLLAATGCRISEALALKYSDIDYLRNKVTINKQAQSFLKEEYIKKNQVLDVVGNTYILSYTKTNTVKTPIVKQDVVELILQYKIALKANDDDYIFRLGRNILNVTTINYKLSTILQKMGMRHRTVHAFRHYHTTKLYEAGCEPKYVAERLGHVNEQTSLSTYKHLTQRQREDNDEIIKTLYI